MFTGKSFGAMTRRRIGSVALAIACIGVYPEAAVAQLVFPDPFIRAINRMKRSVSPVICVRAMSPEQANPIIDGSAFFISERGDFITAAHVVAQFAVGKPLANCPMAIWFRGPGDATHNFNAQVFFSLPSACVMDMTLDIARCHTIDNLTEVKDGKFEPVPVDIDADKRDDGTAVAIMGFPLFNFAPISSRGYIGGYEDTPQGSTQMVIDRAAWPGGSGSPVYDYRGRVVGMLVQAGQGEASGLSIALSGYALSLFMTAHPLGR